jgi:hypothetical protein
LVANTYYGGNGNYTYIRIGTVPYGGSDLPASSYYQWDNLADGTYYVTLYDSAGNRGLVQRTVGCYVAPTATPTPTPVPTDTPTPTPLPPTATPTPTPTPAGYTVYVYVRNYDPLLTDSRKPRIYYGTSSGSLTHATYVTRLGSLIYTLTGIANGTTLYFNSDAYGAMIPNSLSTSGSYPTQGSNDLCESTVTITGDIYVYITLNVGGTPC